MVNFCKYSAFKKILYFFKKKFFIVDFITLIPAGAGKPIGDFCKYFAFIKMYSFLKKVLILIVT